MSGQFVIMKQKIQIYKKPDANSGAFPSGSSRGNLPNTAQRKIGSGCLQGFALRLVRLERDEVLHDSFFGFTQGRTSIRRSTEELSAGNNTSDPVK